MPKDFDTWNTIKKHLETRNITKYIHSKEIWWCSLGLNLGAEIDGKNDDFERPVIVMKVYNKETMLILPFTTKEKNDPFHLRIRSKDRDVWVKLTQTRLISSKRMLRKITVLDAETFFLLRQKWKGSL